MFDYSHYQNIHSQSQVKRFIIFFQIYGGIHFFHLALALIPGVYVYLFVAFLAAALIFGAEMA